MTSENIIGNDNNKEHTTVLFPISEDFFKEETRCGYTVSAKMKRIWAKELDLLSNKDKGQRLCAFQT